MTQEAKQGDKITCHVDGMLVHVIKRHLEKHHPEWTIERYQQTYPGEPILSAYAEQVIAQERAKSQTAAATHSVTDANAGSMQSVMSTFREIFGLPDVPAAKNVRGEDIKLERFENHNEEDAAMVPDVDPRYVFNIDLTKKIMAGIRLRKNVYLWGLHGSGKTTALEQYCARTGRPFSRVQHTANTEESHILGQYVVRDGQTEFQLGPLPMAMMNGWVYCADEYDFAMPFVIAVYQSVMEGKPLVIKDAPPEFRIIRPHPEFRLVATGNTNGCGDETGLYQGTQIQNAANYSRFGVTEEVKYPEKDVEASIVSSQARVKKPEAVKIVEFANKVRDEFREGRCSMTVSPRELITAAELAVAFGNDWKLGLRLAFTNRLSRIDQQVMGDFMQRIWA
ncbi:AAA family ATPase [Aureimonas sp. AU40]|uniref:AAA family ATPase n=1 Tax=Aureimonas sp. AU40 TaxID=1637747 RepID=UPI0007859B4E|nr:MoxR family ATPase [Aureimonas sp. AU40]